MGKALKILVMLLVVAAVVFAAGCSGNTKTTSNATSGATEQVAPTTSIASEGGNQSEAKASVPAETNVTDNNVNTANQNAGNETNVSAATGSSNQSSTSGRISLTAMKREKIRANLQLNNTTANTTA